MAFDSNMNYVLSKPIFLFRGNDWNSSNTLSSPTIYASINSWWLDSLITTPTVISSVDSEIVYATMYIVPTITIASTYQQSSIFDLTKIVRLPQIDFSSNISNNYTLSSLLANPSFSSSFSVSSFFSAALCTSRPTIVFSSNFTSTTSKQTWILNTITDAHSRYTNYDFNSYFKIGDKNFGVKDDGIYEITGDYDITLDNNLEQVYTNIEAAVALPLTNFDEQSLKMCSDAIAYCRATGDLEVVVTTDEQYVVDNLFIYHDDRPGMHRKRVKIPKGLKGNSWQYTIKNVDSSDFGINAFEVMVKTLQRITW